MNPGGPLGEQEESRMEHIGAGLAALGVFGPGIGMTFSASEALPAPFPATQVRQQLTRQRHWRLSLIRLPLPGWAPIENAAVDIDPSSSNGRLQCGSANRARSRSGVEPHQNEFGDVPAAAPIGLRAFLYFAVTPRCPHQRRGLFAGQPTVPWWALIRQHNCHNLRTKPLTSVMIDSGSQVFKLAPSGRVGRPSKDVRPTQITVDVTKHLVAEETQQPFDPARCLFRSGLRSGLGVTVKGQNVSYRDLRGITLPFGRLSEVLSVEVFGERSFSSFTIILAAACALRMLPVSDDPHGTVFFPGFAVTARSSEPQSRSFASSWHRPLICRMAPSVV
jgi:hypothetical protein